MPHAALTPPTHPARAQIVVPVDLADILKAYTKEVIRRQPDNLVEFSAKCVRGPISCTPPPPMHCAVGVWQHACATCLHTHR